MENLGEIGHVFGRNLTSLNVDLPARLHPEETHSVEHQKKYSLQPGKERVGKGFLERWNGQRVALNV